MVSSDPLDSHRRPQIASPANLPLRSPSSRFHWLPSSLQSTSSFLVLAVVFVSVVILAVDLAVDAWRLAPDLRRLCGFQTVLETVSSFSAAPAVGLTDSDLGVLVPDHNEPLLARRRCYSRVSIPPPLSRLPILCSYTRAFPSPGSPTPRVTGAVHPTQWPPCRSASDPAHLPSPNSQPSDCPRTAELPNKHTSWRPATCERTGWPRKRSLRPNLRGRYPAAKMRTPSPRGLWQRCCARSRED